MLSERICSVRARDRVRVLGHRFDRRGVPDDFDTSFTVARSPVALVAIYVFSLMGAAVATAAQITCTKLAPLDDTSQMDTFEASRFAERACNSELVSYEKVFIPFDANGRPMAPVRLTHRERASSVGISRDELVTLQSGDTDDHGLFLSVSASRNTGTGYCSNWSFSGYFKWTNAPTDGRNTGYDFWGMTWAGNQALTSTGAAYSIDGPLIHTVRNHTAAEITPNEGIVWRFKEWNGSSYAQNGYSGQSVRQATCQGHAGNVVIKYIHTFENISYSASIGAGNPGSISVSPVSDQWSYPQSANFSY